ncbi:MAG: calcium-binding protein [Hyphomicrobiaceae bacterium]
MAAPVARWSTPFQISNYGGGGSVAVSSVHGADAGEFVVVWDQFGDPLGLGDASGSAIYGQLFTQEGTPEGSPFLINSSTTSEQVQPVVTTRNDNEGFIVAWRDFSRYNTGFYTDARLRFFDGAAQAASAELEGTNSGPTVAGVQNQVSIARGESGGAAFVTWTDFASSPDGDGMDIRGALFSPSGDLGPDFRITSAASPMGETGFQAQSNVASLPQLGFVVTWADDVDSGADVFGGGSSIRGQLFSYLGVPVGSQFDIASTAGGSTTGTLVQYPQSAGFGGSSAQFVTAWVEDDDTTVGGVDLNVHARIFSVSGNTAVGGTDFILSEGTARNQSQVVVAAYGTDRFIAVWTDQVPFQAPEVRARVFSSSGTPLTAELVVVPEDTIAASFAGHLASVTVLDDTINAHPIPRFVVTWNDNTGNMWGQIFSPAASELLGIDWFGAERGETYAAQYDEHVLAGNGGNDHLTGSETTDDIDGGAGNDTLIGGGGPDMLDGGAATDTVDHSGDFATGGTAGAYVDLASGFAQDGFGDYDLLASIEAAIGTSRDRVAGVLGDVLIGDGGANLLAGLGGLDYIVGNGGNDTIDTGAGMAGVTGDIAVGGAGNDSIIGGSGATFAYGNDGNDALGGGDGDDWLFGGDFSGTVTGTDSLIGGEGADVLAVGSAGGNAIMLGGAGNDIIYGGSGAALNDTLTGGTGSDFMYGGSGGNDRYRFEAGDLAAGDFDQIYGFDAGDSLSFAASYSGQVSGQQLTLNGISGAYISHASGWALWMPYATWTQVQGQLSYS